jgi:ABC-2 type transport system permease protein
MREAAALLRASWLTASTYRMNTVMSVAGMLFSAVPVYFMAQALQPVIASKIATQGDQYFAFVIVGLVTQAALTASLVSFPQAVTSSITTGTLEALLTTPAPWRSLFAGLALYRFAWTGVRMAVLLAAGVALGVHLVWGRALLAGAILLLIVVAHLPVGIVSAAMVVAFRTQGPLPQIVLALSALLGGIYYPTHIIPSWLRDISDVLPLTYGLRALRRVILEGWSLGAVAGDVAIVAGFAGVLLAVGLATFAAGLRYARRAGTLGQY